MRIHVLHPGTDPTLGGPCQIVIVTGKQDVGIPIGNQISGNPVIVSDVGSRLEGCAREYRDGDHCEEARGRKAFMMMPACTERIAVGVAQHLAGKSRIQNYVRGVAPRARELPRLCQSTLSQVWRNPRALISLST